MVRTVPLKNVTAATVATAFCEHWVFHYRAPVRLLSDNGGQFTSKFFQDVCAILGTQKLFTTAYHPQANRQVERFNRTIFAGLRRFCSEHGRDWDKFSHAVTYAYNNTVRLATGLAPLQLVLTRPPSHLNLENVETINPEAYGPRQTEQRFSQRLRSLMQSAHKRLTARQARYKPDFDKRVRNFNTSITPGELVFVQRETATESEERHKTSRGKAIGYHKLRPKAFGPFPVVSVTTNTVTIMRDGIADRISKDRVIRAPSSQRQTSGATESNAPVNPADCATPEASSTATPRLTGPSQDAVLYPAKRAVDLQRMPTSIKIPRLSSRATTEVNPNVVLDDADEDNTESTVNESQDHTTVPEDRPQINDVPNKEDAALYPRHAKLSHPIQTRTTPRRMPRQAQVQKLLQLTTMGRRLGHEANLSQPRNREDSRVCERTKTRTTRTSVFLPTTSRDQIPNTRSIGRIVQVMNTRENHDGPYRSTQSMRTIEDKASKPLSPRRIQVSNKPGKTSRCRHGDHTPCSRQRRGGTCHIPFRPRSNNSRKNTSAQTKVHLSWTLSPGKRHASRRQDGRPENPLYNQTTITVSKLGRELHPKDKLLKRDPS